MISRRILLGESLVSISATGACRPSKVSRERVNAAEGRSSVIAAAASLARALCSLGVLGGLPLRASACRRGRTEGLR